MEENKDFQNSEENKLNEQTDFDELIKSIPDYTPENQEPIPVEEKPAFEGYKTNSLLFHFLAVFGVVFLSIFFMFNVYLSPISVIGQSMLPTINAKTLSNTDSVHNDLAYYREKDSYTYGDIVIISNEEEHYITNTEKYQVDFLIKRVIACPGDMITFFLTDIDTEKHLYYYDIIVKNSKGETIELNEKSYINEPMYVYYDPANPTEFDDFRSNFIPNIVNDNITDPENRKATITISNNCYFVMGDNRNHSDDSRKFGEVTTYDICGSVRLLVKHGETVWSALFRKIKSYLSVSYIYLKENL